MLNALLDRLELCHQDIDGLNVERLPSPLVQNLALPLIYPGAVSFAPVDSEFSAGHEVRRWTFVIEVLIRSNTSLFNIDTGMQQVDEVAANWLETIDTYYLAHRQLETDSEDALPFVVEDMAIRGATEPMLPGPDGNLYFGLVFTLTIDTIIGFIEEE